MSEHCPETLLGSTDLGIMSEGCTCTHESEREHHAPHDPMHQSGPFTALGRHWLVMTGDPAVSRLVDELHRHMKGNSTVSSLTTTFAVELPKDECPGLIYRGGQVIEKRHTSSATFEGLLSAIDRFVITTPSRSLVLHASATACTEGVLIMPALSGSGKTTLTAGLLDEGWSYVSDDAVAIRSGGLIEGYPKPLVLRRGSWDILPHYRPDLPPNLAPLFERQWYIYPGKTEGIVPLGPARMIVFPRYAGPSMTSLRSLRPSDALERIVPCSLVRHSGKLTRSQVGELARLVTSIPSYALDWGDLAEACGVLGSLRESL
jgi:hypothetical protein